MAEEMIILDPETGKPITTCWVAPGGREVIYEDGTVTPLVDAVLVYDGQEKETDR